MRWALVDTVRLLATVFVALCLVPAGAHFFELPNKIGLPPDQYMTVQKIYAGWAFFGIAIAGALVFTVTQAIMLRREPFAFWLALAALVLLVATQVIFWSFTYPMNVASRNWTTLPDHFETARRQWEYSHAVNAGLTLAAFVAIVASALARDRQHQARQATE